MTTRPVLPLLIACSVLLPGCRKSSVETYRVPKDAEPPAAAKAAETAPSQSAPTMPPAGGAAAPGSMANTAVATATGAGLAWTAPANWTSKQGSAMRKGTYGVKVDGVEGEADLAITAFPGDVGGELANVNRWRGQLQLPPVSQGDLATALTRTEANGLKMGVLDIAGGGQRMLGAMVPHAGSTWFFKMQGPDALVAKAKPDFMKFMETVKPAQ